MEIHKPKAAHSWREFLVEIGTIICGILIALGLEQAVESLHERTLRREAQEAIRGEIGRDLSIFARRAAVQACIDDRLKAIEALLVATPLGDPLPRPMWIGRPQVWQVSESRWASAASGGRTALLPADDQARYGEVYASFRELDEAERVEQLAWAHLRTLETLPTLDAPTRGRLIEALHEARYANFRIKIAAAQAHDQARAIGVAAPAGAANEGSRSVCVPMRTGRDEAMRLTIRGRTAIAEP